MPSIRNKLIAYLRIADEKQIAALYSLLKIDIEKNVLFVPEYRDALADVNAFKEGRLGFLLQRKFNEEIE